MATMGRVDQDFSVSESRRVVKAGTRNPEEEHPEQPTESPTPLTEPPATVRKCYVRREMNKRREKNSQAAVFFLDVVRSR